MRVVLSGRALKTVVGKDRKNVSIEVDPCREGLFLLIPLFEFTREQTQ
jgi:hypothetical protein